MRIIPKFQVGGQMAPQEEAPMEEAPMQEAPAQGQPQEDPMAMLIQAAVQALQTQDCQIAMQVCQALAQAAQQGAPEEAQGEPVFARKGCKVVRRIKKSACGSKMKKKC